MRLKTTLEKELNIKLKQEMNMNNLTEGTSDYWLDLISEKADEK